MKPNRTHKKNRIGTIDGSQAAFVLVCAYIATMAYTIPILPVGPWPIWATLPDFVFVALVVVWLFSVPQITPATANGRRFASVFALIAGLGVVSYFSLTVLVTNSRPVDMWSNDGLRFGLQGAIRLIQMAVLAYIASRIPLTSERRRTISRVAGTALVLASVLAIATFFSWVSTATLSAWLPQGEDAAGAWWRYRDGISTGSGVGALNYNRGAAALQLTMLIAIFLQFREDRSRLPEYALIGLAGLAILFSGSRSGLASFLVMIFAILWFRSWQDRALVTGMAGLGLLGILSLDQGSVDQTDALSRQFTVLNAFESDNLSGRTEIWANVARSYVDAGPVHWVFGNGLGSAIDTGNNAHMLILQYLYEFGLVGIFILGVAFLFLLRALANFHEQASVLFWLTVALLIGSYSQENFYPGHSFSLGLSLYVVAVAMALNAYRSQTNPVRKTIGESNQHPFS